MNKQWTTVKITADQQALIKKLIREYPELGYKSVGDFVADAIRELISELRKEEELIRLKKESKPSRDRAPDPTEQEFPH